jgi:hypothetical protein
MAKGQPGKAALAARERQRHAEKAQRHFIRAAAGMTEGALAFALIEGGLGLFHLSRADADQRALSEVEAFLKRVDSSRSDAVRSERAIWPDFGL